MSEHVTGSMVLAVPVALVAGLLSFISPCTLPLLPAYLSYATGLSGQELQGLDKLDHRKRVRSRMVLGSVLFVLGFAVLFVLIGFTFGFFSRWLLGHVDTLEVVLGILVVAMGLVFMGAFPGLQRDLRIHKLPGVGLAAAPVVGFLFGLVWTPCQGPTLGAISTLAAYSGSALRGGILLFAFALGLGVPFILVAVFWQRAMSTVAWLRRHGKWVGRIGGVFLIAIGVLLLTGWWDWTVQWLQVHVNNHWNGVAV